MYEHTIMKDVLSSSKGADSFSSEILFSLNTSFE